MKKYIAKLLTALLSVCGVVFAQLEPSGDAAASVEYNIRFRWDGSAWMRVGKASSRDLPYIATSMGQEPYTADAGDNWNIGWYCAALVRRSPFVMVVR